MTKEEILWNLKIDSLTAMQETAIEEFRKRNNVVLLSPTGSGKTLAYLIPLYYMLTEKKEVQAIVLVPSRELAMQIEQVFKFMGTGLNVLSCYGGRPAMDEHRMMLRVNPQVIISTPGRMNDHLSKANFDASTVTTLVIDEFDKCLELGFQDEMKTVISQLPALKRRYLLSATDAESIPEFVSDKDFLKLNFLSENEQIPDRIEVKYVKSPDKDKLQTLADLLCSLGTRNSLIFVNYRESVERIYQFLKRKKIACEMFHGGMEQRDRERALYKFSNESCNVFVSTDLAARGLDIPHIDYVIHYHLPLNEDAYIHRNGRTARWDAEGHAVFILGPEEKLPDYVQQSVDEFRLPATIPAPSEPLWTTLYIGKGKKDKINKIDIVGFLSKVGGLQKDEIGRIDVKDHYAFVAISRKRVKSTLKNVEGKKIKGIKTIVEETR